MVMLQEKNLPSSSDKLQLSMDLIPCRRLSDSLLSGGQEDLAQESEGQLTELRKWAEEVMNSRLDEQGHHASNFGQQCRSRRSTSSRDIRPDDSGVSFGTSSSSSIHAAASSNTLNAARKVSSTSKRTQPRQSLPESTRNLKMMTELQSPIKLVATDYAKESNSGQEPKRRAHNMHLSFVPIKPITLVSGEKTPKAKTTRGPTSPSWTLSTCESEDDGNILRTPADELAPRHRKMIVHSNDSTKHISPHESGESDEIDGHLNSIGINAKETLQSLTRVKTSRRRGSLAAIDIDLARAIANRDSMITSPHIRREIANPVRKTSSDQYKNKDSSILISPSNSSRVVSAGLEMGMGLAMASSAISHNLPTSSPRGNPKATTTRLLGGSRPRSLIEDLSSDRGVQHVEYQMPLHGTPASHQYSAGSSFISKGKEKSNLSDEVELERRRTTGGVAYSQKREDGMIGRSRHVRTGTHEPNESVGTPRRPGLHRLTSSVSASSHRKYEEDQGMVSAMLRYGQQSEHTVLEETIRQNYEEGTITPSDASFKSISEAAASGGIGTTPTDTPCHSHKAMLSPDLVTTSNRLSFISTGDNQDDIEKKGDVRYREEGHENKARAAAVNAMATNGALLGMGGGGHFGPGVRAKISEVLASLIKQIPVSEQKEETIQLVEYGSLNSRSAQLMQPMITLFTQTKHFNSLPSFHITHEDSNNVDFRLLTLLLDNHPESYLNAQWQESHSPNLSNCIFNSFAARQFAARIVAPDTFHAGISLMDLHWTHTSNESGLPSSVKAQVELTSFLQSRAQEFKKGGVLFMAYIARSDDSDYFGRKDIWTTLSNTLAPCIQRLVSCSMVKSEVARHLLSLPLHPRSAKQTKEALKIVNDKWKVVWSCGLGENGSSNEEENLPLCEALPLRLPHPAWKAFKSGALSRVLFTEHMVQLFKNLYESHFRNVLRDKGKLSKGAVEFVLDSLWDVLFSRIIDQQPSPMKDVEVEVSIVALQRH